MIAGLEAISKGDLVRQRKYTSNRIKKDSHLTVFLIDQAFLESFEIVKKAAALAAAAIASIPRILLSPVSGVVSRGASVGATVTVGAVVGACVGAFVASGLGVGVAVGTGVGVLVGAKVGVAVGAGVFVGALLVTGATVGVGVGSLSSPHAATAMTFITKRTDKTASKILLFILYFIYLPPFDGLHGNCNISAA